MISDDLIDAVGDNLLEASLARVWQHHGKRGFAIISGWRKGNTPEQNDVANERLKKSLKAAGLGYVPVEGAGQEDTPTGKVDRVEEVGFLVPIRKESVADFRKKMIKLAGDFKQYSVLIHDSATGTDEVSPSGKVLDHMTKFTPGKGKFFSRLLRGDRRAFRLESMAWWGIKYASPPESWARGVSRSASGEMLGEFTDRMEDWLEAVGKADVLTDWQLQVLSEIVAADNRLTLPEGSRRSDVLERLHVIEGLIRRGLVEKTGRRAGSFGLTQFGQEKSAA